MDDWHKHFYSNTTDEADDRRQCPICQSDFLGDEPAFLHHVNEHFNDLDYNDTIISESMMGDITTTEDACNALISECPVCQLALTGSLHERELHVEMHFISQDNKTKQDSEQVSSSKSTAHLCECCKQLVPKDQWTSHKDLHLAQKVQQQIDNFDETIIIELAEENSIQTANTKVELPTEEENIATEFCNAYLHQTCVTLGVLPVMQQRLIGSANLCHTGIVHIPSGRQDQRWGCGYRNIQMFMSVLVSLCPERISHVMEISEIQRHIEEAWQQGWDMAGAQQLGYHLQGTSKWIGATEMYTFFSYLGVKCHIIDFHCPSGPRGQHDELFRVVQEYFDVDNHPLSQRSSTNRIYYTQKPPLYLQHQGHSRCIVGLEQLANGTQYLLLFDPAIPVPMDLNRRPQRWLNAFRCDTIKISKARQYQLVYINLQEEMTTNDHVIRSVRIP
ncbi:peptidase family C78-domain-containing protein [Syncephalis fuscata]|nr:peptidase family C78-domain-containing protein [Syncephalis fuscata]